MGESMRERAMQSLREKSSEDSGTDGCSSRKRRKSVVQEGTFLPKMEAYFAKKMEDDSQHMAAEARIMEAKVRIAELENNRKMQDKMFELMESMCKALERR